jgi:serine protease Do
MKKRFLIACITILLLSVFAIVWKTFSGNASANPGEGATREAQIESQAAQNGMIERDEIDEYMKSLPPPKSMTGISGLPSFWIRNVLPDSPAAIAGLKSGDLILTVDGQGVKSMKVMLDLAQKNPGTSVTLDVVRFNAETKEYENLKVAMPTAQWNYPKSEEEQ